ncbi:MAG: hypothetical protein WBN60_04260 [Polyangiales bacterium]
MQYYSDGNILSVLAFFLWIPLSYFVAWRWPPAKATAVLFLGGLLLLPEIVFFKPPGLPDFSKLEIVPLWILIWGAVFRRERFADAPKSRWFRLCVGLLVFGAVVTVFLNTDPYQIGARDVPGHVPYDAVHAVLNALLTVVLPFYLGSVMFRSASDLRVLLTTLVAAALLYSPLQFIELILSPQLHRWVYGFHQHSFLQAMRDGGYRPMVFMAHGLAVAIFTALAVMAAAALYKSSLKVFRFSAGWVASYLWVVLILSKSLAAFLYTMVAAPLVLLASPRGQALTAAGLAGFLFLYPLLRANDVIPVEALEAWAEDEYGRERARSMTLRLENEGRLLDRALERPWFGWGSYCRACVFERWSGESSTVSIRDGAWIIRFGDHGIVGFIGAFGLLLFPLIALVRRMKYVPRVSDRRLLGGLGLMVGFAAFDLIPNGDFTRLALFLGGALWGCLSGILQEVVDAMREKRLRARAAAAGWGAFS